MTIEEVKQLSPASEHFIRHLIEWNVLDVDAYQKPYGENVHRKCRYFAPWYIVMVAGKNKELQRQFLIHEGTVYGNHHVWLEFENRFIIDGTLSQFIKTADDIQILEIESCTVPYLSLKTFSLGEWLEKEETSEF
ncbi:MULTISPECIES: hypothetical protein [unclassified Exiguobacterium]|uniref:hypothetical protein n=1 Tax=unclassified Exiguobacterium TaxID=2644629 RepID=UPI001BE93361|nr:MULTISPECIES: hypothetical protein [unclassified Exiguobacterium]